jgi:hydroxyethylthiazole kinase
MADVHPSTAPHLAAAVQGVVTRIRASAPLVHSITNYVVMNTTANALLALGASPAMVHALEEVEDFTNISSALVVNIGTLSPTWVTAMQRAAVRAGERGILAVAGETGGTKGVDSTAGSDAALEAATLLAQRHQCTVVITGAVDIATDGARVVRCGNGHPLMPRVTGLGCSLSALTGACLAVETDALHAAAAALAIAGTAGEVAAERAKGPGSLQLEMLDALYQLTPAEFAAKARLW